MVNPANPSTQLEGRVLQDGWTVGPLLARDLRSTGGTFSQSYRVTNAEGRVAFLKALDYYTAFGKGTQMIQLVTTLFNFEKEMLALCGERNMDRVVRALSSGIVTVDPTNPFAQVPYLIFESADTDIRLHLGAPNAVPSTAWRLRSLHHIATGLRQLHGAGIAHQDLKPSNVLVFLTDQLLTISKIADLGNASSKDKVSPYDSQPWAGDWSYAPPEIVYSQLDPDWGARRIASDLYLLGSMISFVFSSTTSIASLLHFTPLPFQPGNWGGSYRDVLPYLSHAFSQAASQFELVLPPKLAPDLMQVYLQLCEPDPSRRGSAGVPMNRIALDRFVTRLDLLAFRAECGKY